MQQPDQPFYTNRTGTSTNAYGKTNLDLVLPPDLPFSMYVFKSIVKLEGGGHRVPPAGLPIG